MANNTVIYSKDWFVSHVRDFESIYFKNDSSIHGISIPYNHRTPYEVESMADKFMENGTVNLWTAAWKMGRLDENGEIIKGENGTVKNGYGKEILGLEEYLSKIDRDKIINLISGDDLGGAYRELLSNCPTNFGSVYIIALMYFISNGRVPIYDNFAHIAVKAIYAGVNPNQIYVGTPADKHDVKKAINMLREYMWLLEKVFSKSSINRQTDRALWVYGHANEKFDGNKL